MKKMTWRDLLASEMSKYDESFPLDIDGMEARDGDLNDMFVEFNNLSWSMGFLKFMVWSKCRVYYSDIDPGLFFSLRYIDSIPRHPSPYPERMWQLTTKEPPR